MPQDAFTIYHYAKELDGSLKYARVEKINQPEKDSVCFSLRKDNKNLYLTACAKAEFSRLSVGTAKSDAPLEAPAFCMLLRKHLARAQISKVSPVRDERIVKVTFLCKDELGEIYYTDLYCEIMGKYSNVVLVKSGVILGAMKSTSLDSGYPRRIFPGVSYALPEKQDKISVFDKDAAIKKLSAFCGDLAEYLFENFFGLSRLTAQEIASRYRGDTNPFDAKDFYGFFLDFYERAEYRPNAVFTGPQSGFYVTDYKSINSAEKKFYTCAASACDEYFAKKIAESERDKRKRKLTETVSAHLKKQYKKLQIVGEKMLSCADADKNLLYGQLIISSLYKLQGGETYIELNDYTKEDYPPVKVPLDKTLSPKENAERYFKRYDKQKKTLFAVTEQKKELDELVEYLDQIIKEINSVEDVADFADIEEELAIIGLVKRENKKKERIKKTTCRRFSFGGFDILVGKNNVQNERLTSEAERADVWLHAKDFHSAHVIIKTGGKIVSDDVILFAAEICAYYSDARSVDKVPVDYTLKKYVKKSNGKAVGLVYYTNQKTIFVTPNAHSDNK